MTGTDSPPRRGAAAFFGGWKGALVAALLGLLIGAALTILWSGQLVRSYLLSHPEVLPEAMERLQQRRAAKAVDSQRAAIETPFAGAWAGAKDGDVVLVEFFDYACTYCRRSNADVDRLLREDRKLKVVWRELPVLGPDSENAAEISLAAARQGLFKPFHDKMFSLGRPTAEAIEEARRSLGILPRQVADVRGSGAARAEVTSNYKLASALNATGTPTFVVGDQVFQGAVGYDALKQAIAEAREQS
jgi:protein-disulfide isomerase